MKKVVYFILCLMILLGLSACTVYIDTDPWPASPENADPALSITQAPFVTPEVTNLPQEMDSINETLLSKPTETPVIDDFAPVVTSTPEPNNEVVEPGFNG